MYITFLVYCYYFMLIHTLKNKNIQKYSHIQIYVLYKLYKYNNTFEKNIVHLYLFIFLYGLAEIELEQISSPKTHTF